MKRILFATSLMTCLFFNQTNCSESQLQEINAKINEVSYQIKSVKAQLEYIDKTKENLAYRQLLYSMFGEGYTLPETDECVETAIQICINKKFTLDGPSFTELIELYKKLNKSKQEILSNLGTSY
ncbi:MAG: hypothetical protein UR26_C0002G0218 [candidate division TM6 bacterium GW2011_GWF2_32_72]|nr:MAG: hypothetical protein UR26_C0002G0218 [candidate division TM6 bacterium GW2011_GWF2_32_72]